MVDALARGMLINTATVAGVEFDPNPANDTVVGETTVNEREWRLYLPLIF